MQAGETELCSTKVRARSHPRGAGAASGLASRIWTSLPGSQVLKFNKRILFLQRDFTSTLWLSPVEHEGSEG